MKIEEKTEKETERKGKRDRSQGGSGSEAEEMEPLIQQRRWSLPDSTMADVALSTAQHQPLQRSAVCIPPVVICPIYKIYYNHNKYICVYFESKLFIHQIL